MGFPPANQLITILETYEYPMLRNPGTYYGTGGLFVPVHAPAWRTCISRLTGHTRLARATGR
jgi:hypothetical protein